MKPPTGMTTICCCVLAVFTPRCSTGEGWNLGCWCPCKAEAFSCKNWDWDLPEEQQECKPLTRRGPERMQSLGRSSWRIWECLAPLEDGGVCWRVGKVKMTGVQQVDACGQDRQ